MRIVHVASEAQPYSKTGGLADVAAALPGALAAQGHDVALVTPWYGPLSSAPGGARMLEPVAAGPPWAGLDAKVLELHDGGVRRLFVHRGEYFDREFPYGPPGEAYFDNEERFLFFSRAALAAVDRYCAPDVVHCHDWHTALIPALIHHGRPLAGGRAPACALSIHNLAFQGVCEASMFPMTGLPAEAWSMHEGEFFGRFNLLKAGLAACDAITTVSPTYAREILTPEFGCGLDAFLAAQGAKITGIVNGVDTGRWDPEQDAELAARYGVGDMGGKEADTAALRRETGLASRGERPVLGFVGRLTRQKGADILAEALPELLELGADFVLLGSGDAELEEAFRALAVKYPGRAAVVLGYDEALSHRIMAGADLFLMPSRFEPCGLTQLYAMAYGTVPVTTRVGGLADTVVPHPAPDATGFHMESATPGAVVRAVARALEARTDKAAWRAMQERGMARDMSWAGPAGRYVELYERLAGG